MLVLSKDLHLILDSILRFAVLRRNAGILDPFAVMLTNEGKIVQLGGSSGNPQPPKQEGRRVIEAAATPRALPA